MSPKQTNPGSPRIDGRGREFWAYAPYNFIPLPDKIIPARELLGQDLYQPGDLGLNGWIDCDLETCSPVYIRGMLTSDLYQKLAGKGPDELSVEEKNQIAPFFSAFERTLEGLPEPVIPGSSLRGMLRSLVEIAGFGRMRWAADTPAFTYRAVAAQKSDPLAEPYKGAFGAFGRNTHAGYLVHEGDDWYIQPARSPSDEFGKAAEKAYLTIHEDKVGPKDVSGFLRLNSQDYRPGWYPISFEAEVKPGKRGDFVNITRLGGRKDGYRYKGVLVCSGNMLETETEAESSKRRRSPRRKHALVLEATGDLRLRLRIPAETVRAYRAALTPFQKEKLSDWGGKDWGVLKDGAPVFYLSDGKTVLFFGHSPFFRVPAYLPGHTSPANPRDFIPGELLNDPRPDLAEAIFGWVAEFGNPLEGQRAGRIFFEDAHFKSAQAGVWLKLQPIAPHTLSGPKTSTFQHYLVQDKSAGHDPDDKVSLAYYGTSPKETQIRGHKWYWHRGANPDLEANVEEREHEKQLTRIIPLKPGVKFHFRLRFENLRPEELGALLWALSLPGESGKTYRHKLGMGKPLGMGAVAIRPELTLIDRRERYRQLFNQNDWALAVRSADLAQYIEAFERYVLNESGLAKKYTSLVQVERIQALLAMLAWPGPDPMLTRYMKIRQVDPSDSSETVNEYKERPALPEPRAIANGTAYAGRKPGKAGATQAPGRQSSPEKAPPGYQEGKVKVFGLGARQDYGFIQPSGGGPDVFVHANNLAPGVKTLHPGDRVLFRQVKGIKGLLAQDVKPVK